MEVTIYIALIAALPPALGWLLSARKHRAEARAMNVDAQEQIIRNLVEHNQWLKQQIGGTNGVTIRQELDSLTHLVQKCVDDHVDLRKSVARIEKQTKGTK